MFSLLQLKVLGEDVDARLGGWKPMSKVIRKYSKKNFSAEIVFEYLAFSENHLSNKIEDRSKNYFDRIKDNFILSYGHVCLFVTCPEYVTILACKVWRLRVKQFGQVRL